MAALGMAGTDLVVENIKKIKATKNKGNGCSTMARGGYGNHEVHGLIRTQHYSIFFLSYFI
jgi:hypothetical protein